MSDAGELAKARGVSVWVEVERSLLVCFPRMYKYKLSWLVVQIKTSWSLSTTSVDVLLLAKPQTANPHIELW